MVNNEDDTEKEKPRKLSCLAPVGGCGVAGWVGRAWIPLILWDFFWGGRELEGIQAAILLKAESTLPVLITHSGPHGLWVTLAWVWDNPALPKPYPWRGRNFAKTTGWNSDVCWVILELSGCRSRIPGTHAGPPL